MISPINLACIARIQRERHAWATQNFGPQLTRLMLYGVIEEVGELFHSLLKMEQGIRGSESEHRDKIYDAIGDIVIFTMALCDSLSVQLVSLLNKHGGSTDTRKAIKSVSNTNDAGLALVQAVGAMVGAYRKAVGHEDTREAAKQAAQWNIMQREIVKTYVACYALGLCMFKVNVTDITTVTWEKVKQRNWKDYPTNGRG